MHYIYVKVASYGILISVIDEGIEGQMDMWTDKKMGQIIDIQCWRIHLKKAQQDHMFRCVLCPSIYSSVQNLKKERIGEEAAEDKEGNEQVWSCQIYVLLHRFPVHLHVCVRLCMC